METRGHLRGRWRLRAGELTRAARVDLFEKVVELRPVAVPVDDGANARHRLNRFEIRSW